MHPVFLIHVLPSLAGVICLALVLWALRGRRVDAHPVCRRCGFDLIGTPDPKALCSECGTTLNRRRAIRIGNRQKRRGVIRIGVPLLLACLGWEGRCAWVAAKATDWNHHKPVWWLVRQAHGKSVSSRDAALAELARRISLGILPRDREAALVDEAFALQADAARPWVDGWGTLIEAQHDAHRLSDDCWGLYLFQGVAMKLQPSRPVFRNCDRIQLQICRLPDRLGAIKDAPDWYKIVVYTAGTSRSKRLEIAGRTWEYCDEYEGSSNSAVFDPQLQDLYGFHQYSGLFITDPSQATITLDSDDGIQCFRDGRHTVRLALVLHAEWRPSLVQLNSEPSPDAPPPPASPAPRSITLSCDLIIAPSPIIVVDEALRERVENAVRVERVDPMPDSSWMGPTWAVTARVRCANLPVDVAYCMTIRDCATGYTYDGGEFSAAAGGDFMALVNSPGRGWLHQGSMPRIVDVQLKPQPSASPVDTKQVWGRPLVIRGLKVMGD